jgi:3-dehydroquinate synthase
VSADGATPGGAQHVPTRGSTGDAVTVHVDVRPPYPVRIGPGVLVEAPRWTPSRRVAVISDGHVDLLHGDAVATALEADDRRVVRLVVPPGEASKRVPVWHDLLRRLAREGFGRDDAVVALGGGVVGDLAGFVAASYMRGVPVVQAPTSLLAMADAAIGGKTGVNLSEGKNLVGAFWQPRAVLMDVTSLRTLPHERFAHGLAEVAKHGLLADRALLQAVLDGELAPDADDEALTRWVAASARVKATVVARDERESGTARATLNLGHTVAHALESATDHAIEHGEAVTWGLLYAAHLSHLHHEALGEATEDWRELARRLVRRLAPRPPDVHDWGALAPFVARDKKARDGRRRWVTLPSPGDPRVVDDVPPERENDAWEAFVADVRTLGDVEEGDGT